MTPGTYLITKTNCRKLTAAWRSYCDALDAQGLDAWRDVAAVASELRRLADKRKADCSGVPIEAMIKRAIRTIEELMQPLPPVKPSPSQAFREEWYRVEVPPPPDMQGDGVVIAAGGWRFYPSLYVTVKMIRETGCQLPIEVWYLGSRGEFHPLMDEVLADDNLTWRDGDEWLRDHPEYPMDRLSGWELKALATIGTAFERFCFFDADSYPVYSPEQFMAGAPFVSHGACFFPDKEGQKLKPGQWARFGVGHHDEPAWESGQFAVDRRRHWKPLYLAWWLNSKSPYVYDHIYGDKDTFHIAWRRSQHRVWVADVPKLQRIAYVHRDEQKRVYAIHRTNDKFRFPWIRHQFETAQTSENAFIRGLPKEDIAHRHYQECIAKLPEATVKDAQPPGLLIVGQPRSFTTPAFRILQQALGFPHPGIEAGEVLNHTLNDNAPPQHFTTDPQHLDKCHRIIANHRGEVIKDVAQPHAVRSYIEQHPGHFRVLHIHRDPNDIRRHQLRVWGEHGKPDPAEWETFYRSIADEVVEYEDVIRDHNVLFDAVERMGFVPTRFDYIDSEFIRKREETLAFLSG